LYDRVSSSPNRSYGKNCALTAAFCSSSAFFTHEMIVRYCVRDRGQEHIHLLSE
jgi:hypothetical protein